MALLTTAVTKLMFLQLMTWITMMCGDNLVVPHASCQICRMHREGFPDTIILILHASVCVGTVALSVRVSIGLCRHADLCYDKSVGDIGRHVILVIMP